MPDPNSNGDMSWLLLSSLNEANGSSSGSWCFMIDSGIWFIIDWFIVGAFFDFVWLICCCPVGWCLQTSYSCVFACVLVCVVVCFTGLFQSCRDDCCLSFTVMVQTTDTHSQARSMKNKIEKLICL